MNKFTNLQEDLLRNDGFKQTPTGTFIRTCLGTSQEVSKPKRSMVLVINEDVVVTTTNYKKLIKAADFVY